MYEAPDFRVVNFNIEDIVTTSDDYYPPFPDPGPDGLPWG